MMITIILYSTICCVTVILGKNLELMLSSSVNHWLILITVILFSNSDYIIWDHLTLLLVV